MAKKRDTGAEIQASGSGNGSSAGAVGGVIPASAASQFRDRIIDIRKVLGRNLRPHPKNFRTHPVAQRRSLQGLLEAVGVVDALIAYDSPTYGGLTVIDGHLRQELGPDYEWHVIILDVSDQEAETILTYFDPLGALAEVDGVKLQDLLNGMDTPADALRDLFMELEASATQALAGETVADYSGMTIGSERAQFIELVFEIEEHQVIERAIEKARKEVGNSRGLALKRICEVYLGKG